MTTVTDTGTRVDVPVRGGELAVWRFGTGPRVVLAPHGITANHTSWRAVATALADDVTLLAPDLRGRGLSATLPGPSSMTQHADDLVAVLDHLGLGRATVVGHSMGGFVAVRTALRHPDRVEGLVLVDGGLAVPTPPDVDLDELLAAILGPAMTRLSMTFADLPTYLDHWRQHPALVEAWGPLVEEYLAHDVHEVDGAVASRVVAELVRDDGRDTLVDPVLTDTLATIELPMQFLWAPVGLLGGDPLYPRELVTTIEAAVPALTVTELEGVNHYTATLSEAGAAQVAAAVRAQLAVTA